MKDFLTYFFYLDFPKVSCPDVDIVDKEEVWFDYSVEFSGEPNDALIPPLEVSMLAAVEEKLLPCFLDRRRRLSIEIIGAIDYFPIDEKIDEGRFHTSIAARIVLYIMSNCFSISTFSLPWCRRQLFRLQRTNESLLDR